MQLGVGANVALRRIARVHSRLVTDGDWKTALESARRGDGLVARRERVAMQAVVPEEWGKRSPPRMAALWALGEVERLADTDRAGAMVVGWKYRVISRVTGAVVLETAADYERAGLPQPDSAKQEAGGPPMVSTPEPGTWVMMAIGLAVIAVMRSRGQW